VTQFLNDSVKSAKQQDEGTFYATKHTAPIAHRANLRAAILASNSLFAPVTTILPVENTNAVVLGSNMRRMTAENL